MFSDCLRGVLLGALAMTLPAASAIAAAVQLCGPTVCYAFDDDPLVNPGVADLGLPTLLGNSDVLRFTPGLFSLGAAGPGGSAARSAEFRFDQVWSPEGHELALVSLLASGDYQLLGGGSAVASLELLAKDLDQDDGLPGFPETIAGSGGHSASLPTGLPFLNWTASASVEPAAAFADLATRVSLTIRSHLALGASSAEDGGFLAGKLLLLGTTTVVPLPGTLGLLGTGLLALWGGRGRMRGRLSRGGAAA